MAKLPSYNVDGKKIVHTGHFSVNEVGFFEGPEKLLEIWFVLTPRGPAEVRSTSPGENSRNDPAEGLRIIPRYVLYHKCSSVLLS